MESDLSMNESDESEVIAPSQQYNGKPFTSLRSYDLVGKYFETYKATEKFFYDYADVVGFSVRKNVARRGKDGNITIRQWFCSCEGFRTVDQKRSAKRVRTAKKETRTGCEVAFLVNYIPDMKQYVVKKFDTDHNHPTEMPSLTHHMRSDRSCRDSDVAQVTVLHTEDGESKSRIGYISDRFSKLAFCASLSKELYEMVNEEVDKLERKIEAMSIIPEVRRQEDNDNLIRDPDVVKLKRKNKEPRTTTGKQGRKCGKCGGHGHNKQRCGKNQSSGSRVGTTSMSSGSSEDETDGEGRGESNIPQANEAGPSTTIPNTSNKFTSFHSLQDTKVFQEHKIS